MVHVRTGKVVVCKRLTNFFDVMAFGTSEGLDETNRKVATLTRIELLKLHPFKQEAEENNYVDYVDEHQKTLTVVLMTLRCAMTLEVRYLMVKVDDDVDETALVRNITARLKQLRWVRPDLRPFVHKKQQVYCPKGCPLKQCKRGHKLSVSERRGIRDAAIKTNGEEVCLRCHQENLLDQLAGKGLDQLVGTKLELPEACKIGKKCPECTIKNDQRRYPILKYNAPILVGFTEEDFTVKVTELMYTKTNVDGPKKYKALGNSDASCQTRAQKDEMFSRYMEWSDRSIVWSPKSLAVGTRTESSNLDKRYCPKCERYYQYIRGNTTNCDCSGEETRHPYHVLNQMLLKDKNSDAVYDFIWNIAGTKRKYGALLPAVGKKITRGAMHPSWCHQLYRDEIAKIAEVCGFDV